MYPSGNHAHHLYEGLKIVNTDAAWTKWGDINPYFGVLSDPKYRKEEINDNKESFFCSGEIYIDRLLAKIESTLAPIRRGRALDFGCGVGRLAIPLARRFRDVVGVDVSLPMLAEAEKNSAGVDQRNVKFLQSDNTLSNVSGEYDFVNSYIVFQHIPANRGITIIRHLVDKVARGGVASIHVCLSQQGGRLMDAKGLLQNRIPGVNRLANICRRRPMGEPVMEMNAYDFATVAKVVADAGFGPLLVETELHGRFQTATIMAVRHEIPA